MSKTRVIIAAVLICVGIVGIIPSTFYAIPYVTNTVQKAVKTEQQVSQQQDIATVNEKVANINITSLEADVYVVKSTTGKVQLKKANALTSHVEATHEVKDGTLTINVNTGRTESSLKNVTSFKQFIEEGVQYLATEYSRPKFIVEVPESVNLQVTTGHNDVYVHDSELLKDTVALNTQYGDITIERIGSKGNLKQLTVESRGEIDLSTETLAQFKQVDIRAQEVNIESYYQGFSNNTELYTEQINIATARGYFDFEIPFFKKLNVEVAGYGDGLYIDFPIDQWNPLLNVKSNQTIEIETVKEDYFEEGFNGYIHPNLPKGQMEINIVSNNAYVQIGD
ncbi:MAG: DUF4097 family beta strand repeat-containing protein [Bacillaceae bacterium]